MQGILLAPACRSCGKAIGWSGALRPILPLAKAPTAMAASASAPATPSITHFGLVIAHLPSVQFCLLSHLIVGRNVSLFSRAAGAYRCSRIRARVRVCARLDEYLGCGYLRRDSSEARYLSERSPRSDAHAGRVWRSRFAFRGHLVARTEHSSRNRGVKELNHIRKRGRCAATASIPSHGR